eukprot:CCRYP_016266-RA/>CCRYP_016266-RA protein AED:0.00 eAED:0.00 QI:3123/0/1/1/0/0/2/219/113
MKVQRVVEGRSGVTSMCLCNRLKFCLGQNRDRKLLANFCHSKYHSSAVLILRSAWNSIKHWRPDCCFQNVAFVTQCMFIRDTNLNWEITMVDRLDAIPYMICTEIERPGTDDS